MEMDKDYYRLLQVDPNASPAIIDAAYRILTQGVHNSDLREITEAHLVISNPKTRRQYDAKRNSTDGSLVGGKYRVEALIAKGAIGEVYKAVNVNVGEPVCIKHCSTISKEAEEIFLTQAKALWDSRHHSLPAIRDFLKFDDGTFAVVMSYIPWPTWAEIIEFNGAMNPEYVVWLGERVLNVLRYLHLRGGTIHGDINPKKIMIQPETIMALLVGFDMCLHKPDANARSKGFTDVFSPVEAVEGMPLLPASDFYGLGKVMCYALSGDLEDARKGAVPDSTPESLCDFLKRLILPDVRDRPSWESEDLCDTIAEVKVKCFGKKSRLKPIPWRKEAENV